MDGFGRETGTEAAGSWMINNVRPKTSSGRVHGARGWRPCEFVINQTRRFAPFLCPGATRRRSAVIRGGRPGVGPRGNYPERYVRVDRRARAVRL